MHLLNTYKNNNFVYVAILQNCRYGIVYYHNKTRRLRESALDISEIEMQIDLGIFERISKHETVFSSIT